MTVTNFPDFISSQAQRLSEATSYQLLEQIQQTPLATPLSATPIPTTYVKQGQGNFPMVLLHGFDSSLMEFRRLMPKLATTTKTWAVDYLGFGFTDRPNNIKITPEAIKTHLYCFWQQFIQRPMVLVGASMGGAAAIDFTLSYPQIVEKLVLIDSAGLSSGPAMGKLMIPPLDRLATAFLRNPKVRQKISENAYYDKGFANKDALYCSMLHLAHPNWSRALISFTKSGGYHFSSQHLAEIKPPTLILWGKQDQILGTKDATNFQEMIPHSKLVWISKSGHVPHLEQADETAQAILEEINN